MVILHVVVLWQEWPLIPTGFPDFGIFYTAGTILRQGRGAELYNDELQQTVHSSFAPAVGPRGSIVPFVHPPFEAVFFRPIAAFSYLTAYFLWSGINLGMLVIVALVLRKHLPRLGVLPVWLWLLAGIGFFPIFVALLQGQDSILVLLCYCLAFVALRRDSEFEAGSWLGLGLCKFHLVLPFLFAPLVQKRMKLIAGFLLVGAALTLVGVAAVGWHGLASYPGYVWRAEHTSQYKWNLTHRINPNVRALVLDVWPPGSKAARVAILAISIVVIGVAAYIWRLAWSAGSKARQLAFALNLVATLLLGYHTFVHDLSLLFLPILCAADALLTTALLRPWQKLALWASVAILSFSPVYLVLLLRFSQLQLITLVLLLFFLVLASATLSLATTPRLASVDR
jgi:glycosyl transferase family 87